MDITSGEMYFRIKNAGGLANDLTSFSNFLRADIDGSYQKSELYSQQKYLRNARMHMRKAMTNKLLIAGNVKNILDTKRY